ncbi:NADH-quinone oxidoreductase subunit C [Streptomyces diacarni]
MPSEHPGWLPRPPGELFGDGASAAEAYGLLTVDVPADSWIPALTTARDELGCTFFDWLSAVDEPGTGFQVCAHVAALHLAGAGVRGLLLRTTVPHEAPALPTATGVYAGAAWHERETHEMFGVDFTDHPHLEPLLLPETFEGHPLRKDFVLAARVAKAWPGAKEPGESGHGGPKRRQTLPPGVPDPNEWGPLKGQLPPAPTRERSRRAAGDTPRRARSAGTGSASQRADSSGTPEGTEAAPAASAAPRRPRRNRSASAGSASQRPAAPTESASTESAPTESAPTEEASTGQTEPAAKQPESDRPATTESPSGAESRSTTESPSGTEPRPGTEAPSAPEPPRSADAPWHHARPAHGSGSEDADSRTDAGAEPRTDAGADSRTDAGAEPRTDAGADSRTDAGADSRTEEDRSDGDGADRGDARTGDRSDDRGEDGA